MPENRLFLDSNILLYEIDTANPRKQAIAKEIVELALRNGETCISAQVVQECLSVLTSPKIKHNMATADIRRYFETVLAPLCEPLPALPLYREAIDIQARWKFGFYDALIVAGALALECETLYSEDFQHRQRIEGLTVVNPFQNA